MNEKFEPPATRLLPSLRAVPTGERVVIYETDWRTVLTVRFEQGRLDHLLGGRIH